MLKINFFLSHHYFTLLIRPCFYIYINKVNPQTDWYHYVKMVRLEENGGNLWRNRTELLSAQGDLIESFSTLNCKREIPTQI
jgi:hypothetical protein